MNESHPRRGLVGPLLLVGVGVALLGSNLGWFDVSLWTVLLRAWPVVLVAVGVDLLVPRRTALGTVLAALLVAAVLAGGLWLATTALAGAPPASAEAVDVPLAAPGAAEVEIRPAVGQLRLSSGEASGGLVEASIPLLRGEQLERRVDQVGDRQRVVLRSQGTFMLPSAQGVGRPWDIRLNPGIRTSVEVGMGVGEILFDGRELDLGRVKADLGVGRIEIRLGSGVEAVDVRLGIGQVQLVIPRGTAVRLRADVALGGKNMPPGYARDGDWVTSPGYANAARALEIRASVGIGEITLIEAD